MNPYFLSLVISFSVTGVFSSLLVRWAPKLNLIDRPGGRKIHEKEKPVGGLAVFFGFLIPAIYFDFFPPSLLIGLTLVTGMGLMDDVNFLSPRTKLLGQILAALIPLLALSLPTTSIELPSIGFLQANGVANQMLLLFWVVGATNAVNLIDGLDGLATGLGLIIALFLSLTGLWKNPSLAGALTGALACFILYNFHKAKLFLGDGGSYFLGFLLAFSTIELLQIPQAEPASWPLLGGMILLGLPILDTSWAIIRRVKRGEGIMSPDKSHIHHLLLRKAGPKRVVVGLYITQICLSVLAYFYLFSAGYA